MSARQSGARVGGFELLKYPHDMLVGGLKNVRYQNREFELYPGGCVFVYTDVVPEAANVGEETLGEDRMTKTLNQCPDVDPETLFCHV